MLVDLASSPPHQSWVCIILVSTLRLTSRALYAKQHRKYEQWNPRRSRKDSLRVIAASPLLPFALEALEMWSAEVESLGAPEPGEVPGLGKTE